MAGGASRARYSPGMASLLRHAEHVLIVEEESQDGWLVRLDAGGDPRAFSRAAEHFLNLWEGQIPLFVEGAGARRKVRIAGRMIDRGGGVLRLKLVPAEGGRSGR